MQLGGWPGNQAPMAQVPHLGAGPQSGVCREPPIRRAQGGPSSGVCRQGPPVRCAQGGPPHCQACAGRPPHQACAGRPPVRCVHTESRHSAGMRGPSRAPQQRPGRGLGPNTPAPPHHPRQSWATPATVTVGELPPAHLLRPDSGENTQHWTLKGARGPRGQQSPAQVPQAGPSPRAPAAQSCCFGV